MKNIHFKWLLKIIGIFLLLILFKKFDARSIFLNIKGLSIYQILILISSTLIFLLIKSYRWFLIIQQFKEKITYTDACLTFFPGMFLGMVTPGKVGDLSKAYFLNSTNKVSLSKGITITIYERLLDLSIMLLISVIFLLKFIVKLNNITIFVLISTLIFISIVSNKMFFKQINKLIKWKMNIENFSIPANLNVFYNLLLTIFAFLILMIQVYFITIFLNIDISLSLSGMSMITANLISLIPISISGIGTRETALIFLLPEYSKELIISMSLSFLVFSNILSILIGFIFWIYQPKPKLHK